MLLIFPQQCRPEPSTLGLTSKQQQGSPSLAWKKDGSHSPQVYFVISGRMEPFLVLQPEGSEIKLLPLIRMFSA